MLSPIFRRQHQYPKISLANINDFLHEPLSHPRRPPRRFFATSLPRSADYTHAVIGAGVVGLATARALAQKPNSTTILLERRNAIGTETSSRNSGVIHAGIHYPPGSYKAKLCIAGKEKLYAFCEAHNIPCRRIGKWIVAQDEIEQKDLLRIYRVSNDTLGVPVNWVSPEQAAHLEPEVHSWAGILESPTTGIIDVHAYMLTLLGHFEESGGELALGSKVTAIEPLRGYGGSGSHGWRLTVQDTRTGSDSTMVAETLINSAGLGAVDVHNMIVPEEKRRRMYYAKGNYFAYTGPVKVNRLIYPVPGLLPTGLGTHLTLDMAGRMKFGPDVEWVSSPDDLTVNMANMADAIREVRRYLPNVDPAHFAPDYAGIRPKLRKNASVGVGMSSSRFRDFIIQKAPGYDGWVDLLGIESPGLTSSLAIAGVVCRLLYA